MTANELTTKPKHMPNGYHLILALMCLYLSGCASTPAPNQRGQESVNSATQATLLVYAAMTAERSALMDLVVYVNGQNVGVLDDIKPVTANINPGEVEVVVLPRFKHIGLNGEKSFKYVFNAQATRTHYIRFHQALTGIEFHGTIATPKTTHTLTETSEENWRYRR